MDYEITHLPGKKRFVTEVDGESAYVEYFLYGRNLSIIHTYVPREIGGRGIAAALVEATYSYALENELKPQATCSYAVVWLRKHPEYMK